ncbi:hypothetical protein BD309DRAFT_177876 [Dichomitus squalens]|nr:hypothetical protein BD309DRAFT_177876 [Dichomitus squalens]
MLCSGFLLAQVHFSNLCFWGQCIHAATSSYELCWCAVPVSPLSTEVPSQHQHMDQALKEYDDKPCKRPVNDSVHLMRQVQYS